MMQSLHEIVSEEYSLANELGPNRIIMLKW